MKRTVAIAAIAGFCLGGLAAFAYYQWPSQVRGGEVETPRRPVWTEVQWPFPIDEWGRGKAFRCEAANCGVEVNVYVRAKNIEITGLQPLDHEIDRLPRRPRARRLFGAAARSKTGEDVAGDEKMRADPAAFRVAQLVLQRLGKCLHAGLGDVVGGLARRRGDALLGSGIDDEAGPAALDHMRRKYLRAMDHAPKIDREHALPVLQRSEH